MKIKQKSSPSTAGKLTLLFLMYISQKVFLTFTWTLLPLILRKQGVSLGTIGFTALVYSPWALKFIHAPLVDRYFNSRLGKRKSWITPLLGLSWIILPILAVTPPSGDLAPFLGLVFVLNFLYATIDIAVDGYATDILKPEQRPWGNTIQMVGYLLGYMLGAGVFIIVYQTLGWKQTVFIITLLQLFLMLPIIFHREIKPVSSSLGLLSKSAEQPRHPSALYVLRQPKALWFLVFLALVTIFDQVGNQLRLPLLVDLGINPAQLGRINIWIGTPIAILGSLAGGTLLRRLGAKRVFITGCLGAAAVSLLSALLSQHSSPAIWQFGAIIGIDRLVMGILSVLTYSMTMTMSAGQQSATNYAVLSSAGHLIGFAFMPLSGWVCDQIGYFNIFSFLALSGILAIFIGERLLRKKLAYSENRPPINIKKQTDGTSNQLNRPGVKPCRKN
ncbi:MFS transporter [Dethiosulfatarculus sandiegensis]|uniref:Major facilitator superfamily (MFS) profile domain-containing protein n=1 Tax=Dethiosulfatarculus sandiegensis TaxID=1429043 RepID=A0A0D2J8F7_9BACT|nr:MFS transporter [Dethiosulfatarculus sandiegensis]KIX14454.1 hypothetical protein X474_10185 [Dethiosulfatarculus sandiegensis]